MTLVLVLLRFWQETRQSRIDGPLGVHPHEPDGRMRANVDISPRDRSRASTSGIKPASMWSV
jgi:hypothetical protein